MEAGFKSRFLGFAQVDSSERSSVEMGRMDFRPPGDDLYNINFNIIYYILYNLYNYIII